MTGPDLPGLALFALASSITPGPNNLMLLSSGSRFGLRRTVPHLLGITLGHAAMILLLGAGLAAVYAALPWASLVLKVLGSGYLLYLAARIALADPDLAPGQGGGRPFRFIEAAAFQWVNPKAWVIALTALALYLGEGGAAAVLLVAAVFAMTNLPCVTLWAVAGQEIGRLLRGARAVRRLNIALAVLLVLSLGPMLRV